MSEKNLSDIQVGDAVVMFNGNDDPFAWRKVEAVTRTIINAGGVRFSLHNGKIIKDQPKNVVENWEHPREWLKPRLSDHIKVPLKDVAWRIEPFDEANLKIFESQSHSLVDIEGPEQSVTIAGITRMLNDRGLPLNAELFVGDGELRAIADRRETLKEYENRVYRLPMRERCAKQAQLEKLREEEKILAAELAKKAEEKARLIKEMGR